MTVVVGGRAQKIYVIGDSNGTIFENLYCSTSRFDGLFTFRTVYAPEVTIRTIVDDRGDLHADLRQRMHHVNMVPGVEDISPTHQAARVVTMASVHRERTQGEVGLVNPPIVLSVGHTDYSRVLMQIGPSVDFELPPVLHGPSAVDPVGTTFPVPVSLVRDLIEVDFWRLERALVTLRDSGFGRVSLLGLRPPTLDDDRFREFTNVHSRAHLRYKVTLLFNSMLRDLCERVGVCFVDIWPLLAVGGVFDERYELDYLHFNYLAASRIVTATFDAMFEAFSWAVGSEPY